MKNFILGLLLALSGSTIGMEKHPDGSVTDEIDYRKNDIDHQASGTASAGSGKGRVHLKLIAVPPWEEFSAD